MRKTNEEPLDRIHKKLTLFKNSKVTAHVRRQNQHRSLGPPQDEERKNEQALRYMDPHKHASPFSRRLKKFDGMLFTINNHRYRLYHAKGRLNQH